MNNNVCLSVQVAVDTVHVDAHVYDRRSEVLSVFEPLTDTQRTGLVTDAWTVGLRALMNAYKQADESRLSPGWTAS